MVGKRKAGIILLAVFGLLGLILGYLSYMVAPTKGRAIATYANPRKALLVIDVQEDYTGSLARKPFPYPESDTFVAAINGLAARARARGWLVVYVNQEFNGLGVLFSKLLGHGTAIKGSPGAALDRRLDTAGSPVLTKPKGDAFSNPALGDLLAKHQVGELYLAGLDAEYCVRLTARGALNRGYRVTIVDDGVLLMNAARHDRLWQQFSRDGIGMVNSREI